MSMPPKIDSPDSLRVLVESRAPLPFLGMLLRATLDAFNDTFTIFYAKSPAGMGTSYEPFHPSTAVNAIPGLIRTRLESRFPTIADRFRDQGIKWDISSNSSKNHQYFEILIGDELRIIVTKYNNGTNKININKKKLEIAEMNGMDLLFPEINNQSPDKDSRHTLYIVYGYHADLFEAVEFNAEMIERIDLVYPGIDMMSGKMKQVAIDLLDYVAHMPAEHVNISMVPASDIEDDIELKPNRITEDEIKEKRENEG